jgi:hypothetical protein
MIPLLPVGIGALIAWAAIKKPWKKGLTPEREMVYKTAIDSLKDPAKIRALAQAFDKEGLKTQGDMLRKRADYIELPDAVKAAHRKAFEKAMASTDPNAVKKCAEAFAKSGATKTASVLNKYADGLQKAQDAK